MTANIIAVANQKGGAGKTTVSMNLAGTLARRGHRVLVADADPQGTAQYWASMADDDKPFPAAVIGTSGHGEKVQTAIRPHIRPIKGQPLEPQTRSLTY